MKRQKSIRHTSIRFRMVSLMISLSTIPVIIVTAVATDNTRSIAEKDIIQANISQMQWADQYLEDLIDDVNTLFYTLHIDEPLMGDLEFLASQDQNARVNAIGEVRKKLLEMLYANSNTIGSLTLYSNVSQKAVMVNSFNSGLVINLDISSDDWDRIQRKPVSMYFAGDYKAVHAFHSINEFETSKLIGAISVRIDEEAWEEVERILKTEPESAIFIFNDENELLFGTQKEWSDHQVLDEPLLSGKISPNQVTFQKTSDYYYFIKPVRRNLTVVKSIPTHIVANNAISTLTTGILVGSIFAILATTFAIWSSLTISRPIVRLAKTMRGVEFEEFKLLSVASRDEIGQLERGYNNMILRLKQLIQMKYQQESRVKSAKILALQAQINPHFLNNTLNLIGGMALSEGVPEIYKITCAMGNLMRYSISTDGKMVSLSEEVENLKNYVLIQEQRFHDRCTVTITLSEELKGVSVPQMILQPLVENCFEHGLQSKEDPWRVSVHAQKLKNIIAISVKDNGVGMDHEQLMRVRTFLNQENPEEAFGLYNVNSRLRLQFGDHYRIRIFSQPSVGTLVIIMLPIENSKGDDHVSNSDYR